MKPSVLRLHFINKDVLVSLVRQFGSLAEYGVDILCCIVNFNLPADYLSRQCCDDRGTSDISLIYDHGQNHEEVLVGAFNSQNKLEKKCPKKVWHG